MTKKRLFSETDLGIESSSKELYLKRQMLYIEKKNNFMYCMYNKISRGISFYEEVCEKVALKYYTH